MPRFDDRLKNVLALLESGEHSNLDIVFRHFCDILFQEGLWMTLERRQTIVNHLADYYPKASQVARMEIADIASRVSDAPVEVIALIAADGDVVGNRLWDRLRMTSDDWRFILPRLSRTALGRLRARMDLSDSISIAVDREWRDRTRSLTHLRPSVDETVEYFKNKNVLQEQETTEPFSPPAEPESQTADPSMMDEAEGPYSENEAFNGSTLVAATDTDDPSLTPAEEPGDEPETDSDSARTNLFTPQNEDEAENAQSDNDDMPLSSEDNGEDSGKEDTKPEIEGAEPQILELAAARERAKTQDEPLQPAMIDDVDTEDVDESVEGLGGDPQVEDPKIQDILQRLRDFGSRSRSLGEAGEEPSEDVDQSDDEDRDNDDQRAAIGSASLFAASPEAFDREGENASAGAGTGTGTGTGKTVPLFVPMQPDVDEEDTATQDAETPVDRIRRRLSVNGLSPVVGARWVTDRFGSLVETGPYGIDMFGLPAHNIIGEILSSLFTVEGRQALDKSMSARRGFRDTKTISLAGAEGWSLAGVPVFDEASGIFLGFRGTAKPDPEFAEARKAQQALEETVENASKDAVFDVTGLAHELKTPLNAIRGFAEMIQTQQLGETSAFAQNRSANIGRQAQRLSNVLDDLLSQTKSAAEEDAETSERTPVLDIVTQALSHFSGDTLITERLAQLDPALTTLMTPRFASRMIERLVYYAANWTPSTRPVLLRFELDVERESPMVCLHARLPGWSGGTSQNDLMQVSKGPRLPYNHPLADSSLEGRSLASVQASLDEVGALLELTSASVGQVLLTFGMPVEPAYVT